MVLPSDKTVDGSENDQSGRSPSPLSMEVRAVTTMIREPPVREPYVEEKVTLPVQPIRKAKMWPRIVGFGAAGLVTVAAGVALGMSVNNAGDVDSLRSDVSVLQSDLAFAQQQAQGLSQQLVTLRSGTSLANEHLAQAPGGWAASSVGLEKEHSAQAPTAGTTSLGLVNEHVAQAPR